MSDPQARHPDESIATTTTTVLPADTNAYGNLFGGALVALIDKVASITASRHARRNVVTASIDRVDFLAPVRLGDVLTLRACIHDAGRTSMDIGVEVTAEDRLTGRRVHACSALLIFVAIGDDGQPVPVPPVAAVSPDEKGRQEQARVRAQARRERRSHG